MRFLLTPVGSSGDVHPFVGIGLALQSRGHDVTVMSNGYFESLIRNAGLGYIELGTREAFLEITQNKDIWHPRRGPRAILTAICETSRALYDKVAAFVHEAPTVVAAGSLAFGARVAQDKLGFPMASIHLQPALFRSVYEPPVLPPLWMPHWMPDALKRFQYRATDVVIDFLLGRYINDLRRELGLPPVSRILDQWVHSPQRVIGLFPDWFAPPQLDWPPQTVLTGFPLYDERGVHDMSPSLSQFLASGDAPIVFTPGSANRHAEAFFQTAVEACTRLGRRGVLLTRFAQQIPTSLPPHVHHEAFVPLSQLLPRSAAMVHHGGIGTLAQCLAAGIPQLIMPLSHDQPDNVARVRRMGVGEGLKPARFTPARVAARLDALLSDAHVSEQCRHYAQRLAQESALEETCRVLEAMQP